MLTSAEFGIIFAAFFLVLPYSTAMAARLHSAREKLFRKHLERNISEVRKIMEERKNDKP